jgi:hypothetical protein
VTDTETCKVGWWRHYPWSSAYAHHKPNYTYLNPSKPYLFTHDSSLYAFSNQIMAARLYMKLGMDVVPQVTDYTKRTLFNIIHSVIPTWRILEVVRLNNDGAIAYAILCVRFWFSYCRYRMNITFISGIIFFWLRS